MLSKDEAYKKLYK